MDNGVLWFPAGLEGVFLWLHSSRLNDDGADELAGGNRYVDMRVEWTETNGWGGAGACAQWRAFDDVVEVNEASVQQIHQIG